MDTLKPKQTFKDTTVKSDSLPISKGQNVEFRVFPTKFDPAVNEFTVFIECTHDGVNWKTYLKASGTLNLSKKDIAEGLLYGLSPLHDKIDESCQVRLRVEVKGEVEFSIEGGIV